jgi:hypothetical protein
MTFPFTRAAMAGEVKGKISRGEVPTGAVRLSPSAKATVMVLVCVLIEK